MTNITITKVKRNNKLAKIVLIGWLGSRMKYLNKYSDIWNAIDCSTVNIIDERTFIGQFLVPNARASASEAVLKELIKDKLRLPIIFHVFSNGGANIYAKLIREIYSYNSVFNYEPIHVAGVIFDSCPGRPKCYTGLRATLLSTPYAFRFLVYFGFLFTMIPMLLWEFGSKIGICSTWYDEIGESDTRFPQQFIYSSGDELIKFEEVEEMVARRKLNNKVFSANFGSQSAHVAHLRYDKERYVDILHRFYTIALGRKPKLLQ